MTMNDQQSIAMQHFKKIDMTVIVWMICIVTYMIRVALGYYHHDKEDAAAAYDVPPGTIWTLFVYKNTLWQHYKTLCSLMLLAKIPFILYDDGLEPTVWGLVNECQFWFSPDGLDAAVELADEFLAVILTFYHQKEESEIPFDYQDMIVNPLVDGFVTYYEGLYIMASWMCQRLRQVLAFVSRAWHYYQHYRYYHHHHHHHDEECYNLYDDYKFNNGQYDWDDEAAADMEIEGIKRKLRQAQAATQAPQPPPPPPPPQAPVAAATTKPKLREALFAEGSICMYAKGNDGTLPRVCRILEAHPDQGGGPAYYYIRLPGGAEKDTEERFLSHGDNRPHGLALFTVGQAIKYTKDGKNLDATVIRVIPDPEYSEPFYEIHVPAEGRHVQTLEKFMY